MVPRTALSVALRRTLHIDRWTGGRKLSSCGPTDAGRRSLKKTGRAMMYGIGFGSQEHAAMRALVGRQMLRVRLDIDWILKAP
ncbi:hypothetical protein RvY_05394 [Ramazzottius varieornatus]|uniref:Uncharacterized protein n=1 Tax=Ramazzottius varieornatus TaxID=947166 RepID=A0A1D1V1J6_RAMVA|nr:hypothetical protein RvY_05394 [Ramazzottius varieornatus]